MNPSDAYDWLERVAPNWDVSAPDGVFCMAGRSTVWVVSAPLRKAGRLWYRVYESPAADFYLFVNDDDDKQAWYLVPGSLLKETFWHEGLGKPIRNLFLDDTEHRIAEPGMQVELSLEKYLMATFPAVYRKEDETLAEMAEVLRDAADDEDEWDDDEEDDDDYN